MVKSYWVQREYSIGYCYLVFTADSGAVGDNPEAFLNTKLLDVYVGDNGPMFKINHQGPLFSISHLVSFDIRLPNERVDALKVALGFSVDSNFKPS
jgi:hypothetical protein